MNLSELSVRRPVLMTMVYVLIAILAVVFIMNLDIALFPSIDMPVLSVIIDCNDAGPEEIEQQVARTVETSLSGVENLSDITTLSRDGMMIAVLQFNYGTDLDEAKNDVEEAVSLYTYLLPSWCNNPEVMSLNFILNSEILRFILTGDATLAELQEYGDNIVSPLLERVPGVASVTVSGGPDTDYVVRVDQNRLEAYGLSISSVTSAVASANVQTTGGTITTSGIDYSVTMDERFFSVEDIENTVVTTINGIPILVKDVASVSAEPDEDNWTQTFYNGEPVVTITVTNDSDSTSTTVAAECIAILNDIQDALPEGVEIMLQRDSTEMISNTMGEVMNSLFQGIALAALVIFIFLRNIKATIIISFSMPICVLITMMCMSIMGISINMMSMVGLILGIGMTVDASIIILENIYTQRQLGKRSAVAAILGSKNMFAAICASTLTTICVFLPMIIYKNDLQMIGVMIQDMIMTVVISLAASLFVAVTLVPALCGSIMRLNTRTQKPLKNKVLLRIDNAFVSAEEHLRNGYAKALDYCLDHRALIIMILVLILILSCQTLGRMGMTFVPSSNTDDEVKISLDMDPGTTTNVTMGVLFDIQQQIIDTLPEGSWESIVLEVSSYSGSLDISLPDVKDQTVSAYEVTEMIRPLVADRVGETWAFSSGRGITSSDIDIEIHSTDTDDAVAVSNDILALLEAHVPMVQDVESDLNNGSPKIQVSVDWNRAQDLGVSLSTISSTLDTIGGTAAASVSTFSNDTTYYVYIKLSEQDINDVDQLGSILVQGSGGLVRLDSFCTFEYGTAPIMIQRENKIRVNHVTANTKVGYVTSDVQNLVDEVLDTYLVLPDTVTIAEGGQMANLGELIPAFISVLLLALLLVYGVMAAQFESLINPLIVFATIPMLLIGVVAIHVICGETLSAISLIGIVALIGVVVNNGIVLVDCIERLVKQRVPVKEACLQAARGRLRPILMTTLTTILAMIPMAFFPAEGTEMMQPIALTFIGGIITGAFLTLFLSPILYSIFNARREKKFDDPDTLTNQLREYDNTKLTELDSYL